MNTFLSQQAIKDMQEKHSVNISSDANFRVKVLPTDEPQDDFFLEQSEAHSFLQSLCNLQSGLPDPKFVDCKSRSMIDPKQTNSLRVRLQADLSLEEKETDKDSIIGVEIVNKVSNVFDNKVQYLISIKYFGVYSGFLLVSLPKTRDQEGGLIFWQDDLKEALDTVWAVSVPKMPDKPIHLWLEEEDSDRVLDFISGIYPCTIHINTVGEK